MTGGHFLLLPCSTHQQLSTAWGAMWSLQVLKKFLLRSDVWSFRVLLVTGGTNDELRFSPSPFVSDHAYWVHNTVLCIMELIERSLEVRGVSVFVILTSGLMCMFYWHCPGTGVLKCSRWRVYWSDLGLFTTHVEVDLESAPTPTCSGYILPEIHICNYHIDL